MPQFLDVGECMLNLDNIAVVVFEPDSEHPLSCRLRYAGCNDFAHLKTKAAKILAEYLKSNSYDEYYTTSEED